MYCTFKYSCAYLVNYIIFSLSRGDDSDESDKFQDQVVCIEIYVHIRFCVLISLTFLIWL